MPSNVGQENSYEVHHALVNYFPFWVVFFGLVALYFHLAVLGAKISQQIEYKKQVQEVKLYGQIALWILGVMFVFAFLAFDRESNILLTFLGIFGVALSSLAFTFAFPVFLYLFFLVFPYVYIYIYAATVKSETAEVAKKHTKNKRPDDLIEDELANAMIAGLKTDQELKEIINEMSPAARYLNTVTYKKKAKMYREVNRVMKAQEEALKEKEYLGMNAHELERAKRGKR